MRMEGNELFAHPRDQFDLLLEDLVERGDVLLDIGARLVHVVQVLHLLLDEVDHVVDVASVPRDQLLLLLEDLLNQPLVLRAKLVLVPSVLVLQVLYAWHSIIELHAFVVALIKSLSLRQLLLLLLRSNYCSLRSHHLELLLLLLWRLLELYLLLLGWHSPACWTPHILGVPVHSRWLSKSTSHGLSIWTLLQLLLLHAVHSLHLLLLLSKLQLLLITWRWLLNLRLLLRLERCRLPQTSATTSPTLKGRLLRHGSIR